MRFLLCVLLISVSSFSISANTLERNRVLRNGAKGFQYCSNCHTIDGREEARFGPDLLGVVNRPVASVVGYPYSEALKEKGGIWDYESLDHFIAKPSHVVGGIKMAFAGLMSPHQRADLIEYLAALGDNDTGDFTYNPDALGVALSKGDAKAGGQLFPPCLACHNASEGAGHKIGPNLYGIVGREIASSPGFHYSERLRRRNGYFWTPENLNAFLFETKKFEQGTHVAYLSLNSLEDRANLIAYLGTLKD